MILAWVMRLVANPTTATIIAGGWGLGGLGGDGGIWGLFDPGPSWRRTRRWSSAVSVVSAEVAGSCRAPSTSNDLQPA